MKRIKIFLTLIILPIQLSFYLSAQETNEKQLIQKQFVDHYTSGSDDEHTMQLLTSMQQDGTWQDVDYTSKQRGGWPTLNHLKHLVSMASSYANSESVYFKNANLRTAILNGLNHWIEKDYSNPNW